MSAPPRHIGDISATDRRLLSASSLTFLSRAFAKAAQILFLIPAAHLLSLAEFAAYSYVLVVAAAFTILSDTGVPMIAGRDIAAGGHTASERFWSAAPVVAASAAFAAVGLVVFGAVDSGPGTSGLTLAAAAGFVLANRWFDFEAVTLRALGRFGLEAALQAAGAALFVAAGIAATAAGASVTAIVAILLAKELLSAVVAHAVVRRYVGAPRLRTSGWRTLVRAGVVLSLAGITLAIVSRLPLAVLGNTGTAAETAVFSAAQRFADAAVLLATTVGVALLPGLSYLVAAEPARVRPLLLRVVVAGLGVSVVVALVALPLGDDVMELIFGADYAAGGDLLRILLAGAPGYVLLGVLWYALIALHAERAALNAALAGLAVSVAGCAVLVPAEGDEGAAWTCMAALATIGAVSALAVVRRLP